MKKSTIITLVIVAILAIWSLSSYNSLVTQREVYTAQWSQVENQYQRRFDLIPNLVNAIKGSLNQELEVFGAIAEARTRYSGAKTQEQQVQAASQVESALGRLLVITENYPELKSSLLVQDLLVQLEGTENRVSVERQKYNESIRTYNLSVQRIPGSIFAAIFGFNVQPYFESAEGSDLAPTVDLVN
jgi:LemA protein